MIILSSSRFFIVIGQSAGTIIASALVPPLERSLGALHAMLVAASATLAASSFVALLAGYTQITILLVINRLLVGVYSGLAAGLLPIYIRRIAPTQLQVSDEKCRG